GFEVVLEMNSGIEGSVSLLRPVLEVDLSKRQAHSFRCRPFVAAAVYDAGDYDVVHLDDKELLMPLALLPMCDGGFLHVFARCARLQQFRRCLIDLVNDGKILKGRLPSAASTASSTAPGIRDTPGER